MSEPISTHLSTLTQLILDTNVAVEIIRHSNSIHRFHPDVTILLPAIVLGELFHGAFNSKNVAASLVEVEDLADGAKLLVCDSVVSRKFGEVRRDVWRKGKPIPDNDVWIAATALVHNLPLVTNDQHFREVEGLVVVEW